VWKCNVDFDSDGYEKTEHLRGEIVKEDNDWPVLEQGTWRIGQVFMA
jgi:hypothetical protein